MFTQPKLTAGVISLFPELITDALSQGVVGRAIESGLVNAPVFNPRDYGAGVHNAVDDRPYGGGPGMVMQYEPLAKITADAKQAVGSAASVIYLSPQGERFTQQVAEELAALDGFILVCGRYEGLDERYIEKHVDRELSLGDFVLSGGEMAALAIIDATIRLVPGVLGDALSAEQDSFSTGLLDHPHYSRPEIVDEMPVPDVLLSGNHAHIADWRLQQALGRTWLRRPDLLAKRALSEKERKLLDDFIENCGKIAPLDMQRDCIDGQEKK